MKNKIRFYLFFFYSQEYKLHFKVLKLFKINTTTSLSTALSNTSLITLSSNL